MSKHRISIWLLIISFFIVSAVFAQARENLPSEQLSGKESLSKEKSSASKNDTAMKTAKVFKQEELKSRNKKIIPKYSTATKVKSYEIKLEKTDQKLEENHGNGNVISLPGDSSQLVNIAVFSPNASGQDAPSSKISASAKIK